MNIDLQIRPYRPEDKPRLLSIWRAASEIGHPFFSNDQLDEQQKLVEEVYLPKAENWVAQYDGEPVGFIGLMGNFVGGLFVAPEAHGLGIGRALIAHALEHNNSLELDVYALNESAVGFYHRLGFVEVSRRPTDDNNLPLEVIKLRN
jgi:putative acetyltransferase